MKWSGDKSLLTLTIGCQYLAERINPTFEDFYIELVNVDRIELDIWSEPGVDDTIRTDLKTIFETELEILSSVIENDRVIITCNQYDDKFLYTGANLTISCASFRIYNQNKAEISLESLIKICNDYWNGLRS